jgi:hypothetical protein
MRLPSERWFAVQYRGDTAGSLGNLGDQSTVGVTSLELATPNEDFLVTMRCPLSLAAFLTCSLISVGARGVEPTVDGPKPVPATRPEIKQALESLKWREPRLPLPPPTDEERKAAGDRPVVNNGRMASIYLPAAWRSTKWGKDPAMTLDYALTTECFWIVSRANNCHY